jgi:hypothetical protein
MSGGLINLVAYGAQDVYLTGNPNITFFNTHYRRHSSFANETIQKHKHIDLNYTSYNTNMSSECAICLSEYDLESLVHVTRCNHMFHHECLRNYLENIEQHHDFYKCPLCRTDNNIYRIT